MRLEEQVGELLLRRGLTLATAESCTGGLLSHRLTNVPGSSGYFLGGVVAYSNRLKETLLNVAPETLRAHGAVSAETAQEMARGARQCLGADTALSITGIAGPTGGTAEKPVGLMYVCLSSPGKERSRRILLAQDRLGNKQGAVEAAMRLLIDSLQERERGSSFDFVREGIRVESRLRPDGTELPLAFMWEGQRYEIVSWGRESTRNQEGRDVRCYLVQTTGPQTWELCQDLMLGQWILARRWPGRSAVG